MDNTNTTKSHHEVWGDSEFAGHYQVDENGNAFESHKKKSSDVKKSEPVKKEEPVKKIAKPKPKPKAKKQHYVQVGTYDGTYDVYDDDYEFSHPKNY